MPAGVPIGVIFPAPVIVIVFPDVMPSEPPGPVITIGWSITTLAFVIVAVAVMFDQREEQVPRAVLKVHVAPVPTTV